MKIRVYRTSDYCGRKKPCDGIIESVPYPYHDSDDEFLHYIEIDPEDLFPFVDIQNYDIVVAKNQFFEKDGVKYEIEIYDSYRE